MRRLGILLCSFLLLCGIACKRTKDSSGSVVKKDPATRHKILSGVQITGIKVDHFPRYSRDGEKWDAYAPFAEDPDVFMTLSFKESRLYRTETLNEALYGSTLEFKSGMPWNLKPFDQVLLIEAFDEDGISAHDNLGYITFNPMDYKDWKYVTMTSAQGELVISVSLEWSYK